MQTHHLPITVYLEDTDAQGIVYHEHRSPWSALCSHARWLRAMAKPTSPATLAVTP